MPVWTPDLSAARGPRYLAIADALARDIAAGRLEPGDRLPPQRDLADALGVTLGTITRAYAEAERRRLVRGEVGRGTFIAGQVPGQPLKVPDQPHAGRIDLSLNVPVTTADPELPPALEAIARRPDVQQLLRYMPAAGLPRYREAGARWLARFGLEVPPSEVLVCSGAQHAVFVTLAALAEPGDVVLTEALSYPGLKTVADLLHLRLEPVPIDQEGLIPEQLEAACLRRRARALYTMPTLHNPTTGTLSETRRQRIAELARAHDLLILEDDVHRLLEPDALTPLTALCPERAIFVGGMSKSVAGGLRVAFLRVPPVQVERVSRAVAGTLWNTMPLGAELAATWIDDGTADRTIALKRPEAAARQATARSILGERTFRGHPSAYHIWLELPEPWRGAQFTAEAERLGVLVTPPEAFVVGRAPVPHAVRVSLGAAESQAQLEAALRVLAGLLEAPPPPGRMFV